MIMFSRRHDEILAEATEMAFREGFEQGKDETTDNLERGFSNTLEQYNKVSMDVRAENAKLAIQVRKLEDERDVFRNRADKYITKYRDAINEVDEKEKKIDILKFFLRCNYRKDVARYEEIAKRTKKIRIKEKAEKKIIKLKELELAFE